MNVIPNFGQPNSQAAPSSEAFARGVSMVNWRAVLRTARYLVPLLLFAYFLPQVLIVFAAAGLWDVFRNRPCNVATMRSYFFGNGLGTWLLSPFNLLMDLLTLPFVNRGIYKLQELPVAYQREIDAVIAVARRPEFIHSIGSQVDNFKRGMILYKWYGKDIPASIEAPEFHARYRYIRTIGISAFNKQKSTSFHFGPLRATLRVLYSMNDIHDPGAFIEVGDHVHRWCDEKLFIFDDTLRHRSCNETDQVRYCLFVDILRPSLFPRLIGAVVAVLGAMMLRFRHVFYRNWKMVK